MDTLSWLSVDLVTGAINCDLPALESAEPFRRTLGQFETSTATLTVTDGIDPNWQRGILEGASACIAYTGSPGQEVIVWGGVVNRAPRTLGNTVQLSLITIDGYLDRCYTGAYSQTSRDQNLICTDLVAQFAASPVHGIPGVPFTSVVGGGSGTPRAQQYNDYDDKTVYSNLQDLMSLDGGPEWTAHWQWDHNTQLITPVFYVGTETNTAYGVGTKLPAGLNAPAVTFDETMMIDNDFSIPHDWSSGAGANIVTATSSGQGLSRLQATAVGANGAGRPHYEMRFQAATSLLDNSTIQDHANGKLALVETGGQAMTFSVAADLPGATLGKDWFLGDDIGITVASPTVPDRITIVARCVGYEVSPTKVTPLLYVPQAS